MMDSNNFPGNVICQPLTLVLLTYDVIVVSYGRHQIVGLIVAIFGAFKLAFHFHSDNVGAGEREARIASDLVAKRHFRCACLCVRIVCYIS